jgi:hypothetical protein
MNLLARGSPKRSWTPGPASSDHPQEPCLVADDSINGFVPLVCYPVIPPVVTVEKQS